MPLAAARRSDAALIERFGHISLRHRRAPVVDRAVAIRASLKPSTSVDSTTTVRERETGLQAELFILAAWSGA